MLWRAADLATALGVAPRRAFSADGVSIDSRTLKPGDLFVALADQRDGHQFVEAALRQGAAGALIRSGALALPPDAPVIEVADPLAALTRLAAFARARFAGKLAAITGSVGKTTTKEMLRTALAACGTVHAADASFNNHIGVPLTLVRLPADARYAVIEIGMNHLGEIAPLAALARPDVALVTTIASAHIGLVGSLAAIAREKAAIFGGLAPGGTAVFPLAVPHRDLLEASARGSGARCIRVGSQGEAALLSQTLDAHGSALTVRILDRTLTVRLQAPGAHIAANAVLVLAAAAALGADPAAAAQALAHFQAVAGRGAQRPIMGGAATLLDESYNASTLSVQAALALLDLLGGRRRVAVLGDMRELGEHAAAEHRSLAEAVRAHADLLFTCGPLMRHLHESLPRSLAVAHAEDAAALAPIVVAAIAEGDVVLVKGSLGSQMRRVAEALIAAPTPRKAAPMLYNLLSPHASQFLLFNLVRYITFRSGAACLTALLLSFYLGPHVIARLRSVQRGGQPIRDDGPARHLIEKRGTPTMGGVLILLSLAISTLLWADLTNGFVWSCLLLTLAYGGLGSIDDYLKLARRNHKGVSARGKLAAQILIGLIAAIAIRHFTHAPLDSELTLPLFKDAVIPMGAAFPLFGVFVLVGFSNAVNLTDGLDGLAIVPTIIAAGVLALIAYLVGNRVFADYLQLHPVPGVGELCIFLAALMGAGLGFLWFNAPPAAVFMGDTGSLALGGALGAVAIATKNEIVLGIVGGLFVVETVSVVVQVFWYKRTKRRVFLMAPLHHHFEKKGWAEPTIVIRFWIISVILALIGLATLKIR